MSWRVIYGRLESHQDDPPDMDDMDDQDWATFDEIFEDWDEAIEWAKAVVQGHAMDEELLKICPGCIASVQDVLHTLVFVIPNFSVALESGDGDCLYVVRVEGE